MTKPPSQETMPRRSFLKLAGLAALLGTAWRFLNEPIPPSTPIEIALFNFLKLTPEQCQLSINPGAHNILDPSMDAIKLMEATILTGEQDSRSLSADLTIDPKSLLNEPDQRNICTDPGLGSSSIARAVSANNLQEFIRSGGTIITADGDPTVLITEEQLYHLPKKTIERNIGLAVGGATFLTPILMSIYRKIKRGSVDEKKNLGEDEKRKLKDTISFIFLSGVALKTGVLLGQTTKCTPPKETVATETIGRVPSIEEANKSEIEFEKFLNSVTGEPPVMGYYDGLIHVRNLEMAYNLWRVVAESVGKGQKGVKIFEKHGNSHGSIEDLFVEGPEALQRKLLEYMTKTVEVGKIFSRSIGEMIDKSYVDENLSKEEYLKVLNQWSEYAFSLSNYIRFFQETTKVGDDPVLTLREVESVKRPPSARTLMFREMIDEINLGKDSLSGPLTSKSGLLKSALMIALAEDAKLESKLVMAKSNLRGIPRQETVIGQIDLQKTPTLWFDQLMKSSFTKYFYTVEDQLIVGCIEVNGRICPVVREFTVAQDQIVGIDKVLLGNDQVAMGSKSYFYTTNKPDNLPEYLSSVNVIKDNEKSTTDLIDITSSNGFNKDAVFWSQDQTDPAKINFIRIK